MLDAAQTSTLGWGPTRRVMSAVLLFQGKDNMLRVVSSRRLARPMKRSQSVTGILGLALKQAEPVFGGDACAIRARYFIGFQDAKSVLAIPCALASRTTA